MTGVLELALFGGLIYWLFNERLCSMVEVMTTRLQAVYKQYEQVPSAGGDRMTHKALRNQVSAQWLKKKEAIQRNREIARSVLDKTLYQIKEKQWSAGICKGQRPFMGLSCDTCTPSSRNSLVSSIKKNVSVVDVLKVQSLDVQDRGVLAKLFPQLTQACSFQKYHLPYIFDSVLKNERLREVIETSVTQAMIEAKDGPDPALYATLLKQHEKRAKRILMTLRSTFSDFILRLASWVMTKVMSRLFSAVVVHPAQVDMLKRASTTGLPLIFVPLHRSHLDYIVITYTLCNNDIKSPLVAAGENLRIPVFGWLLRGLGAFFIKRRMDRVGGTKDILYRAVLHTYMMECLRAGHNFEFFIEGGRTRTGKPCMPKGGLLSVFVDAYLDGTIEDALLVPVSLNYDRLVDGNFVREQMGQPKQMETFRSALSSIWHAVTSYYGTMRVDFNQPFSLRELVKSFQGRVEIGNRKQLHCVPSSASLYGTDVVVEEQRQLVDSIARHIIYDCYRSTAIMSTNAVSFLLLTMYRDGVKLDNLVEAMDRLRLELNSADKDLGFTGESIDVVNHALELLGPALVHKEKDGEKTLVRPVTTLPNVIELNYYASTLLPHYVLEGVVANAVVSILREKPKSRTLTMDQILERCDLLCDILQFEFIFTKTCQQLSTSIAEAIYNMQTADIFNQQHELYLEEELWSRRYAKTFDEEESDDEGITREKCNPGPEYEVNLENPQLRFYCDTLRPLLDAYIVSGDSLSRLVGTQVAERDLVHSMLADIKALIDTAVLHYGESLSVDSIRNSLKVFEKWGVVECHSQDGIKLCYLNESFDSEMALKSVTRKLLQFKLD